jgi:FdhE protein
MAAEFLRKFLGRPPALVPDVAAAQTDLDRLGCERPTLAGPAAVLRDLLPDLVPRTPAGVTLPLTRQQAQIRRQGGVPLLRGEAIALDLPAVRRRWLRICAVLGRHQDDTLARRLAAAVRRGSLNLEDLWRQILAGSAQEIHAQAEGLNLSPDLTATVLRLTLLPDLAGLHAALAPLVEGISWAHGCCPTCGSWPLLGEYRGLEQQRFLRCGLCAAEWEVPRLLCPFCTNRDHRSLGYFSIVGEEARYRVTTCDACRGGVKMVTTLSALSLPQLLVADVATLHLDLAAADRGFAV